VLPAARCPRVEHPRPRTGEGRVRASIRAHVSRRERLGWGRSGSQTRLGGRVRVGAGAAEGLGGSSTGGSETRPMPINLSKQQGPGAGRLAAKAAATGPKPACAG